MTVGRTLFMRANLLVWCVELTVLALLAASRFSGALFPEYDIGWLYPIILLMVPLTAMLALVVGGAAAGFHLVGREERFWETTAPLNLAFVCLFLAFAAMPPPPALAGATGSAMLAVICVAVLLRRNAPPRKQGLPLAIALPLAGKLPPLTCWASVAAALVFIGVWAAVRFEWAGGDPLE